MESQNQPHQPAQSPPIQQHPISFADGAINTNVVPTIATATGCVVSSTSTNPNVVTIPVPICPPEDIYTYVAVKGSLHDTNASIFGLNKEEILALSKRFSNGQTEIVNGVMVKGSPIDVVNCLSKLGYKVICSTGEAEIVWTMQREI